MSLLIDLTAPIRKHAYFPSYKEAIKVKYTMICSTCKCPYICDLSRIFLKAMNHTSSKNPQIQKLLEKCHELFANKEIVLCWILSHIGIQGEEMVDQQAKSSLSLEPTSFKMPFSSFKPSINKYVLE